MLLTVFLKILCFAGISFLPVVEDPYLVLVDPGQGEEFLPAARCLADFHGAAIECFDAEDLGPLPEILCKHVPRFVAFVLPPERIDVELCHRILEMAASMDADPFLDIEYGFITGRDGEAALSFVRRILAAWERDFGRRIGLYGSIGGAADPIEQPLTTLAGYGFVASYNWVKMGDEEEKRRAAARQGLAGLKGKDGLIFFSHGNPQSMEGCFRAGDLKAWEVDLSSAVLINCACFNGVTGRWFMPGPQGPVDQGCVAPEDSVALALLDTGVSAYVAGVDSWHGPLANQVFCRIFDEGLGLGLACKRIFDRLALDFLPERIHFSRASETGFIDVGNAQRRLISAAMILFGDPAFAPYAKTAVPRVRVTETSDTIRLEVKPPLTAAKGFGFDLMIFRDQMSNYFSVRSENFDREMRMEIVGVVPTEKDSTISLSVVSAVSGKINIPCEELQAVWEETARGDFLHVRVPLELSPLNTAQLVKIGKDGLVVQLAKKP